MSNLELTPASLPLMVSEDDRDHPVHPICQILTLKRIANTSGNNAPDRFRVILSDGENYIQGEFSFSHSLYSHVNPALHDFLIDLCFF